VALVFLEQPERSKLGKYRVRLEWEAVDGSEQEKMLKGMN
jgi:hypothetical protein